MTFTLSQLSQVSTFNRDSNSPAKVLENWKLAGINLNEVESLAQPGRFGHRGSEPVQRNTIDEMLRCVPQITLENWNQNATIRLRIWDSGLEHFPWTQSPDGRLTHSPAISTPSHDSCFWAEGSAPAARAGSADAPSSTTIGSPPPSAFPLEAAAAAAAAPPPPSPWGSVASAASTTVSAPAAGADDGGLRAGCSSDIGFQPQPSYPPGGGRVLEIGPKVVCHVSPHIQGGTRVVVTGLNVTEGDSVILPIHAEAHTAALVHIRTLVFVLVQVVVRTGALPLQLVSLLVVLATKCRPRLYREMRVRVQGGGLWA